MPVTGVAGVEGAAVIVAFVDEAEDVHPSLLMTVKE